MVHQVRQPGYEAEVDFGEFWALIAGVMVKLWIFSLRFDSLYCRPGVDGAHEKGRVEGDIGWFRRNHLVPVPTAASLAELNEMLALWDQDDLARVIVTNRGGASHHRRRDRRRSTAARGTAH